MTQEESTSFCHVDDTSLKTSSPSGGARSRKTHDVTSSSSRTLNNNDVTTSTCDTRRVSSTCSTCGMSPPLLNHKQRSPDKENDSDDILREDNGVSSYEDAVTGAGSGKEKSFSCVCETCGSNTPSDINPNISTMELLAEADSPAGESTITRCPTCGVNPSTITSGQIVDCITCGLIQSYQGKRASSPASSMSSRANDEPIRSDDHGSKVYDDNSTPATLESQPCLNCGMVSTLHPHIPNNICSICGFTNLRTLANENTDANVLENDMTTYSNGLTVTTTEVSSITGLYDTVIETPASPVENKPNSHVVFKAPILDDGTIASVHDHEMDASKYEYYGHTTGQLLTNNTETSCTNVDTEVEKLLDYGKRLQENPTDEGEVGRLPEFTNEPMRRQSETSTASNDSVRACHKIEYDEGSNSSVSEMPLTLPKLDINPSLYGMNPVRENIPSFYGVKSLSTSYYAEKTNVASSIPIHASSSSGGIQSVDYLIQSTNYDTNTYNSKLYDKNYKSVHHLLEGVANVADGALDGTLVGVKDFSVMSEALHNDEVSVAEVKDHVTDISDERRNFQTQSKHSAIKTYPESIKSEATSYLDADIDKHPYRTTASTTNVGFSSSVINPPPAYTPVAGIKLSHLPLPGARRKLSEKPFSYDDFSQTLPNFEMKESVFGLASSKYKFPSDSELSKQSASSSDIESYIMNETRARTRRNLPTPGKRRQRSPSRSPQHLVTRRNSDLEYKSRFMRSTCETQNNNIDVDVTSPSHDNAVNGISSMDMRPSRYKVSDIPGLCREVNFLRQECESLERQLMNKETVVRAMQDELKEESESMAILEQKDKEITLKSESLSQITQLLQKTKKELEHKSSECNRRENETKHIREELKSMSAEKKDLEHSLSEQQLKIIKLESAESRLSQMTEKYDQVLAENRELVERIKSLEINEKEFIDLERNVIELQTQLHDMEDIELHRDELLVKLQDVKKQRDEFLEKGKMVEEERNEFVRSNKTLEQYILEWKRKTTEFKKTNQGLKDRIMNVEKEKKEMEVRIQEIQTERTSMQTMINKLEGERDDLLREMREMKLDRQSMEAKTADLEEAMYDYDHLEEGFHSLRLKLAELTRQRDDTELLIPSYKAKVKVLKKTVREKEETIMQLSHEIKTMKVIMDNFTYDDLTHFKSISGMTSDSSHTNKSYSKKYRPSDMNMTSESETYDLMMARSQPQQQPEFSDDSESFTKEERKRNSSSRRKVEWI